MKSLTPAEKASTLDSFALFEEAHALPIVDRSTLERYATCPAQARFVEDGRVQTDCIATASGNEVHAAFSKATQAYIDRRDGWMTAGEVADELDGWLRAARPDVQPDAIRGGRASVYAWAKFLAGLHHDNIRRFDGGEGDRTGQLARDLSGVRVTAEVDLLYAGPAKQLLHEIDYKSGHKVHSTQDVRDSFQFQLHWWLVSHAYLDVEALAVTVWNTRQNKRTWAVEFTRNDLPAIETRVRSAVGHYLRWKPVKPEQAETWPTIEKCEWCPAAHLCPALDGIGDWSEDNPAATVDWLVSAEARVDSVRKRLTKLRDRMGRDIESEGGVMFGRDKGSSRKPTAGTYTKRAKDIEPEGDSDASHD